MDIRKIMRKKRDRAVLELLGKEPRKMSIREIYEKLHKHKKEFDFSFDAFKVFMIKFNKVYGLGGKNLVIRECTAVEETCIVYYDRKYDNYFMELKRERDLEKRMVPIELLDNGMEISS